MRKVLAVLGIILVLVGTYMVYVSSETKGKAATYGPNAGTLEEREYLARQARYARMGSVGYALIVLGSLMGIPLILSTP